MKLRVFDSPQEWETAAVEAILDGLEQAALRKEPSWPLHLCLSGGSTPAPIYALLAKSDRFRELASRHGLEVWVGDEREAAEGSGLRNSEMIAHALADALSLPGIVFHPWPVGPRETASRHYAELLTTRLGPA
ncbi:MAG: 6-phosphogluconolactonase, partial [Rectinemataceae bacterium]